MPTVITLPIYRILTMSYSNNTILREMTDQSDEIFFIYDPHKSGFVYVNDAFELITRKTSVELYQNPLSLLEMIHPEDLEMVKWNFKQFGSRKTVSILDFRIIRPDTVQRWIHLKVYPILEKQKVKHITGIAEDDSARKASAFNMQKINGWKDSVLEILCHDLRGPIGIITNLLPVLSSQLPASKKNNSKELLQLIGKICRRNLNLITEVLVKESLETAAVKTSLERLDLVEEIRQVLEIFQSTPPGKIIHFTQSCKTVYAQADGMKFLQIMNNLISNAIKFTPDDGRIDIHIEKLEESALITIRDNGIGIPRSLQPFLFDKRTKAGRKGLKGEEPIGLGMWIVKNLTEAHSGRVWFESTDGKGSKFYIELPLNPLAD